MRAQGSRARKTGVYGRIHEDLSTRLTPPSRKRTVFRGALESVISHGSPRVPRLPTAVFRFNSHVKKERCFSPRKNPCFCSIYSITTLRYDGHRQKLDVLPLVTPRNSFRGMLKKAASGVLALLPCSRTESTLRASKWLRPCWTDFFEHSLPLDDAWFI